MNSTRTRPPTGSGTTNLAGYRSARSSNPYSIPARSLDVPLRTVLLDPKANNIPPSKTQSELKAKIKKLGLPHNTYDLDGDGEVSQDDYRKAKHFDKAGTGQLTNEQYHNAKAAIVNDFVNKHQGELDSLFGPSSPTTRTLRNTTTSSRNDIMNSSSSRKFESGSYNESQVNFQNIDSAYEKMKTVQRTLKVSGSWPIKECMELPDDTLIKHNYFTDKFDQTAWNDFDAIPRSCSIYGLSDHGGSRKRLMFSRRQTSREQAAGLMDEAREKLPFVDTRRLKLISDISVENS